jgi:hypothetical protein
MIPCHMHILSVTLQSRQSLAALRFPVMITGSNESGRAAKGVPFTYLLYEKAFLQTGGRLSQSLVSEALHGV